MLFLTNGNQTGRQSSGADFFNMYIPFIARSMNRFRNQAVNQPFTKISSV